MPIERTPFNGVSKFSVNDMIILEWNGFAVENIRLNEQIFNGIAHCPPPNRSKGCPCSLVGRYAILYLRIMLNAVQ